MRLWLVVRATVSLVLLAAGANPFRLSFSATCGLLALTIAIAFVDARRHHELVFVGNLGIHPATLALFIVAPAIIGEGLIRTTMALLA